MSVQSPKPKPFDHQLSNRLDVLIVALEGGPPAARRLALRYLKALLETRAPAFGQKARAA